MGIGQLRNVLGIFVVCNILPVILLIACNFIPAAKRNPKVVYGICAVLAPAVACIMVARGGDGLSSAVAVILAELFFFWEYRRAARKNAASGARD
jgi:hypothetical protein